MILLSSLKIYFIAAPYDSSIIFTWITFLKNIFRVSLIKHFRSVNHLNFMNAFEQTYDYLKICKRIMCLLCILSPRKQMLFSFVLNERLTSAAVSWLVWRGPYSEICKWMKYLTDFKFMFCGLVTLSATIIHSKGGTLLDSVSTLREISLGMGYTRGCNGKRLSTARPSSERIYVNGT